VLLVRFGGSCLDDVSATSADARPQVPRVQKKHESSAEELLAHGRRKVRVGLSGHQAGAPLVRTGRDEKKKV
jgi:hypothetical protein